MQTVTIMKGTRFQREGAVFEILKEQLPGEYVIKNLSQNKEIMMSQKDIISLYEKGVITFEAIGPGTELIELGIRENRIIDFSMLPENLRDIAKLRHDAIKPLLNSGKNLQPKLEQRVIELKLQGIDVKPLTLRRWHDTFFHSGQDITSLIPNTQYRGSGTRLSAEVEQIIDHCIDQAYAKRERLTAKDLEARVMVEIENKNKFRTAEAKMEIPSYNTLTRRIKQKDPYEMMEKREGEKHAFDKLGSVAVRKKPNQPFDVLEMDHTKLDLFVVDDESGLPLGRPYLTLSIDKTTGAIVGVYVAFHPPSYVSVMKCLLHAMTPKTYVKELYPDLVNTWDMFGVPKVLVVDNGKEFRSRSLQDACDQLFILLDFCPPRKPWYKGQIERTFRTINQQLLHKTPGTTFSNILDKKDYNPEKNAIVGYHAFIKLLHQWIVDQYLQQFNRGVKGIPSDLWAEGVRKWGHPPLLYSIPDWNIILGKLVVGAAIQRAGVQYKHMFYNSAELQELKRELLKKGVKTVNFKYDPYDMSKIHVFDELNRRYLEVLNTDQDYSAGLTEFSHSCIVKRIHQAKSKVNLMALAQAKEKFMEEINKEMKLTKGPRAAAFTQMTSAQHIEKEMKKMDENEKKAAQVASEHFKNLDQKSNGDDWEVIIVGGR